MVNREWLARYDAPLSRNQYKRVILSCDPAGKAGANNDYTAIVVAGIGATDIHLLQVSRGHWTVMQMRAQIIARAAEFQADLVIVEDTSSGMGLIQLLREQPRLQVRGRKALVDKETRMSRHQARFEAGRILLPREAPWLADFEAELLTFPHGRYDDQVDAVLLVLDWLAENETYLRPMTFHAPIIVKVQDRLPREPRYWGPVGVEW